MKIKRVILVMLILAIICLAFEDLRAVIVQIVIWIFDIIKLKKSL